MLQRDVQPESDATALELGGAVSDRQAGLIVNGPPVVPPSVSGLDRSHGEPSCGAVRSPGWAVPAAGAPNAPLAVGTSSTGRCCEAVLLTRMVSRSALRCRRARPLLSCEDAHRATAERLARARFDRRAASLLRFRSTRSLPLLRQPARH